MITPHDKHFRVKFNDIVCLVSPETATDICEQLQTPSPYIVFKDLFGTVNTFNRETFVGIWSINIETEKLAITFNAQFKSILEEHARSLLGLRVASDSEDEPWKS